MAIFTLGKTFGGASYEGFLEYNYNAHGAFNYISSTRSSTQLYLFDDANNYTLITGTGFVFDANGFPTAGTVTGYQYVHAGVTELNMTGGTISAVALFNAAFNSDNWLFNSLLASGNDTFNGTALDDYIEGGTNAGGDVLNGLGGNDYLSSGLGDDTINGGDGADFLVGGAGTDFLNGGDAAGTTYNFDSVGYGEEYLFQNGTQGIYVNLSNIIHGGVISGKATDSFGFTDTLTGIEEITGTGFNDTIYARDLSATKQTFSMAGFVGNDVLVGTANGRDIIYYSKDEWFAHQSDLNRGTNLVATLHGITVNFSADINGADGADGTISDSFGGTDSVSGIDRVEGTAFSDIFNGGAANEIFLGWKGADVINGGGGFDTAGYWTDVYGNGYTVGGSAGINANLTGDTTADGVSHGTVVDGFGTIDTLTNIEEIDGTQFSDLMVAGADGMTFYGDYGSDTLTGGAGVDTLDGGAGNDTLRGNGGNDVFIFEAADLSLGQIDTVADYTRNVNGVGDSIRIVGIDSTSLVVSFDGTNTTINYGPTLLTSQILLQNAGTNPVSIYEYTDYYHAASGNLAGGYLYVSDAPNQASHSWLNYTITYDANGINQYGYTNKDDGTRDVSNYDTTGVANYSSYISSYDAANQFYYRNTFFRDGTFYTTHIDLTNQPWTSYDESYDNQSRLDYRYTINDDGSSTTVHLDRLINQPWKQYVETYDSQLRLDYRVTTNDDNSLFVTHLDHNNNQSWSSYIDIYNALGQHTFESFTFDTGQPVITKDITYDNAGQLWDQDIYEYNAAHTQTSHYRVMDDHSVVILP